MTVATNWVGDVEPGTADVGVIHNFDSSGATFRSSDIRNNNHYQFTGTTFWDIGNINSRTKTSHLEILDSAVFKMGKAFQVEGGGTVTVNSSSSSHTAVDSGYFLSFIGSNGTVNHVNGIVDTRQGFKMELGSGNVYNLVNGQLLLADAGVNNRYFSILGDNYLNFDSAGTGEVLWNYDEDMTTTFTNYINSGNIRINGAVADVSDFEIVYTAGVGTTMTIPEPATLGLISMVSFGLLCVRRILG